MNHHIEMPPRASGSLIATLLILTCSLFATDEANAFTRTITDIEDPAVKVEVLGLEAEATRTAYTEETFSGPLGSMVVSTTRWDHSLSGRLDASMPGVPMPKISFQRNPTALKIEGKVTTFEATGSVKYEDFEHCQGGRTTTKSPLLAFTLSNVYPTERPAAPSDPEMSLATENLDPWEQTCPYGDLPPEVTRIDTYNSPTNGALTYVGMGGPRNAPFQWVPLGGGLTTKADSCTPAHCDFTLKGNNANSTAYGRADTSFTLRLRLEYPADPPKPVAAPDTKITKHPKKVIRTKSGKAKIAFRFKSTGPRGTTFKCRLDKRAFAPCSSPFKRTVGPGKHRFAVVSVNEGGADPSPAVHKWTVKRAAGKK